MPRSLSSTAEALAELLVHLGRLEAAPHVAEPLGEAVPHRLVERLRPRVLGDRLAHLLAEALVASVVAAPDADHAEAGGQQPAQREVVERRHELAVRQVAGASEDHERARARDIAQPQADPERVLDRELSHPRTRLPSQAPRSSS